MKLNVYLVFNESSEVLVAAKDASGALSCVDIAYQIGLTTVDVESDYRFHKVPDINYNDSVNTILNIKNK